MLQYVLTALAGIALGIVGMRVWQSREAEAKSAPAEDALNGMAAAPSGASTGSGRKLLIGAGALVALAAAVFVLRPSSEGPTGVSATAPAGANKSLDDVDTMITRLAERLKKEPNDGEGFRMLGWSYVATGKPQLAIEPYKRAMQLLPGNATVQAGYGEALVGVAGGKVTEEAKAAFEKALSLDPKEPRGRYFAAMWLAQNGQPKVALDQWIALANSGPSDAPWQADVQRQIKETSAKLGVDVSSRLKSAPPAATTAGVAGPTADQMAAAQQMPADQRQASVDSMVSGLANKLAANPKNPDGWVMLLRSRMVLKQEDQAAKDLVSARKALSGDAAGLAKINSAAKDVGVPGA